MNGGLVPILETPTGDWINESGFIAQFACDLARGKGLPFWPHETAPEGDVAAALETGKHRLAIQKHDSLLMATFWRPYLNKF
jgi:glutathione S-transferase